ncbi:MAG: hypothetical protein M3R50_06560 [Bacteroidota bacterium]|nr:hypothetical protein [Bacteroidota bacterium]
MNVDALGVCGVDALLTELNFRIEHLSPSKTWWPLTGFTVNDSPAFTNTIFNANLVKSGFVFCAS